MQLNQQDQTRKIPNLSEPPRNVTTLNSNMNTPAFNKYRLLKSQLINNNILVPLLSESINSFFQATSAMEDEILLPTLLKDIPPEELILDTSIQADDWHQLYNFLRDIRNQLMHSQSFADDHQEKSSSEPLATNDNDVDYGISVLQENSTSSSVSSISSSDGADQSHPKSDSSSHQSIKEELKYHYYGLVNTLNTLTSITNRVTEKYRDQNSF